MPRRLLITGGDGMLASDLAADFAARQWQTISLSHQKLDITQGASVQKAVDELKPDVVVNTAVWHVEPSENDPMAAYNINAWGVRNLAMACQTCGAALVQISTCGLFGDEIRPYHEYDPVTLKTVYARSKWEGEQYARLCGRHYILRLGWLYGGGVGHARNFAAARYREALAKPVIQSASDKWGSPTWTLDVARALPALLESGQYGLYHLAGEGGCNRAQYVEAILRAFGLPNPVEEVDSSHFPRKADVPDCEILTSYNLGYAGLPRLPMWRDSLERYLRQLDRQGL